MATTLTAAAYRNLCDSVCYWADSVSSAVGSIETARESDTLRRSVAELNAAAPKRWSADIEQCKAIALAKAERVLASASFRRPRAVVAI